MFSLSFISLKKNIFKFFSKFLEFKNIFILSKNIFLFVWYQLKKFILILDIIIHIILYFFWVIWVSIQKEFMDPLFRLELRSLTIAFFLAYIFYYTFVIEISSQVLGYSMACYRYAFIMAFILSLVAWRIELFFLKFALYDLEKTIVPPEFWYEIYEQDSPFGFFDFLTSYRRYNSFYRNYYLVHEEEIVSLRDTVFTTFYFFTFFTFLSCSYRYDPWFIKFIVKFFHPFHNFFESRRLPGLEDWYSAPIRTRNWWVYILEYNYADDEKVMKWLKKVPYASPTWEIWADLQRDKKTSLWQNTNFSDIHYLRVLKPYTALRRLVFDGEQPYISADWFEPNWDLFFLRYLWNQFDDDKKLNFWTKYFSNDLNFWKFVQNLQKPTKRATDWVETRRNEGVLQDWTIYPSFHDALFYANYIKVENPITNKKFENHGINWEFYDNITEHSSMNRDNSLLNNTLAEIFTKPVTPTYNQSISDLWRYHKRTSIKKPYKYLFDSKMYHLRQDYNFLSKKIKEVSMEELMQYYTRDINVYFRRHKSKIHVSGKKSFQWLNWRRVWKFKEDRFRTFTKAYDIRLTAVENHMGLKPWSFPELDLKWMNWTRLNFLVWWRVARIKIELYGYDFRNFYARYMPNSNEKYFFQWKYFKASPNFEPMIKKWEKIWLDKVIPYKWARRRLVRNFYMYDKFIFLAENKIWYRKGTPYYYYMSKSFKKKKNYWSLTTPLPEKLRPSSLKTIEYIGTREHWMLMPGYVWHYYPTFFGGSFSTFGVYLHKYNNFVRKWNAPNALTSEKQHLITAKQTAPHFMYSQVEPTVYLKPLLELIELAVMKFLDVLSYPVEILITKIWSPFFEWFLPAALFLHFSWFLYYYVYMLVGLYVTWIALKYYYYHVGFWWDYEIMFDSNYLGQHNSIVYWHPVTDICWYYRTPDKFILLGLQTLLYFQYSFSDYLNFSCISQKENKPFLSIFFEQIFQNNIYINFLTFSKLKNLPFTNWNDSLKPIYFYKLFFKIIYKKFKPLVYEGGFECNLDTLIWSYFSYLEQSSMYISAGLIWNFYFKKLPKKILSNIRQFITLLSTISVQPNFFFFSTPLLDFSLSRKLILNIYTFFEYNSLNSQKILYQKFFFWSKNEYKILALGILSENKFLQNTLDVKTASEVYSLLNADNNLFISKLNIGNFWDDPKYWLFAFFWSFRFIPKTRYPFFNIHLSQEANRLRLSRIAYGSSWIGQSMYTRPFFNLIQHLWWTSQIYFWAFTIIDFGYRLSYNWSSWLDQVRNFSEKWYNLLKSWKVETIFGIVRTLHLPETISHRYLGYITNPNNSFNETYPERSYNEITTNWSYDKVNPPLNIAELGITPLKLINLFNRFSPNHTKLYLTFLTQLDFLKINKTSFVEEIPYDNLFKNNLHSILKMFEEDFFYETALELPEQFDLANTKDVQQYDTHLKSFDFNLNYNKWNFLRNWCFGFDTSFFLSHFSTWDYFTEDLSNIWPKNFLSSNKLLSSEQLNLSLSFWEMLSKLTYEDHWLEKPFGSLDKSEMFAMRWHKQIKNLDLYSFTSLKNDPFINYEKEYNITQKGYALQPFLNVWNAPESYDEIYFGVRKQRFPFNLSWQKNSVQPIILGWVGTLMQNTLETSNMLFSFLYKAPWIDPEIFKEILFLKENKISLKYRKKNIETFFSDSSVTKIYIKQLFTWLNVTLHPSFSRYSYGMKASSWFDYWSWKTNITINYWNGFYYYRPYLTYRHSLGTKLSSFDPTYGFYKTYRQFEDNPYIVDLDTDAMRELFEPKSDNPLEPVEVIVYDLNDPKTRELLVFLSHAYREFYYCFQHPFFLGYLVFWFCVYLTEEYYLGISNYSFRRTIISYLILRNYKTKELSDFFFDENDHERLYQENSYRKMMFWYWTYWLNPVKLTNNFLLLSNMSPTKISTSRVIHKTHWNLLEFLYFMSKNLNFTEADLQMFLDIKKINLNLLWINWLTIEMPFFLNSYLPQIKNWFSKTLLPLDIYYDLTGLSYSHYDSIKEHFNLNILFDWSHGSYLDLINFSSYYSTYRSNTRLSKAFYEIPNSLVSHRQRTLKDDSKETAVEELESFLHEYHDTTIGYTFALYNVSVLHFFTESLSTLMIQNLNFESSNTLIKFLYLYSEKSFTYDFYKIGKKHKYLTTSKIHRPVGSIVFYFLHWMFMYNFYKAIPYDIYLLWFSTGVLIPTKKILNNLFSSLKFWIFLWFYYFEKFYKWIGKAIKYLFLKI